MGLIADIFVTVKPTGKRLDLTRRSLLSLLHSVDRPSVRLHLFLDGPCIDEDIGCVGQFDHVLHSMRNEGLGPTINRAISHISSINRWYDHPLAGDPEKVAPFVCMCQDDIEYTPGWLDALHQGFLRYEQAFKLGFATGHHAVEHDHKVQRHLKDPPWNSLLCPWIRATQMFGRLSYWEQLMPIPAFDVETQRPRARPNDGVGSSVDWWLLRNHALSVTQTGRTNLVIPGLVRHIGYDRSTWLDRALPESEADRREMHAEVP